MEHSRGWPHVESREQALALVAQGQLEPLLLLPAELGGEPVEQNTVYVPRGVVEARDRSVTDLVLGLVEQGAVDSFTATPEYAGTSFVPTRIQMRAWREGQPGGVEPVLEIWQPGAGSPGGA